MKIVDPRGEMLAMDWEKLAVLMANARSEVKLCIMIDDWSLVSRCLFNCSTDEMGVAIATIVESTGLSLSSTGQVICARDTR